MTRNLIRRTKTHPTLRRLSLGSVILPAAVLVIGLAATGIYAYMIHTIDTNDFEAGLTQQADSAGAYIDSSMKAYGQRLGATAALFSVKSDVTPEEWSDFHSKSLSRDTLSALMGIGYVPVLSHDVLRASESSLPTSRGEGLTVYPAGEREQYAPILYLEPRDTDNQRAIGYDMYTDSHRRAAMERARDTGGVSMSSPVLLVQDTNLPDPHLGVLLYYPVYRTDSAPQTVSERQAALKGFVYVVLRPHDVVSRYPALSTERFEDSQVELNDVTSAKPGESSRLFEVSGKDTKTNGPLSSATYTISLFERNWQVRVSRQQLASRQMGPSMILITGGTLSLILAVLSYLLFSRRIHRIQSQLEGEVQRTKDELLALASHQLRTPASAVKQYIGMLTMGLGGELTPQQKVFADKAYETNERQLTIINELLYVSKLDAKQLVIDPRQMNIVELVHKSIDGVVDEAADKDITITFATKKPRTIVADARYISMAIDNLISNAIKYSYSGSKVRVQLESSKDLVALHVKDSGVGIDEHDFEKIFQKFTRVDNPLSRESGGSGLGLFLARQLARAHGGDIVLESTPQRGSTFTLILPKKPTIDTAIVHLDPTYRKSNQT